VWQELDYRIDCRVTKGGHIEHLQGRTETWSVSPSVDMLPFGVTILATVPQRSEIPEGLMNYPVFLMSEYKMFIVYKPLNCFIEVRHTNICNLFILPYQQ
jgi:hypothetical protein